MAHPAAFSDPSASGICVPLASNCLSTLRLHLKMPELAIVCTICKYALHLDSVTRNVGKHKIPLWERAALTRVVQSLRLPNPRPLHVRPDPSPAHPELAVRHGHSCTRCGHRTTSSDLFGRHARQQYGRSPEMDASDRSAVLSLQSWSENGAASFWIFQPPDGISILDGAPVLRRVRLEQLHSLEHRALSA